MHIRTASCLIVGMFCAGGASAAIVHFTNPSPGQPGHFHWRSEFEVPHYLDITRASTDQPNIDTGSSIGQVHYAVSPLEGFVGLLIGPAGVATHYWGNEGELIAFQFGASIIGLHYQALGIIATEYLNNFASPFPEGERRYVGVVTDTGSYGWIEVERFGLRLAAYSWAYETEPGAPILAGQIPAPGAVSALGIGALLAPCRRARRATDRAMVRP